MSEIADLERSRDCLAEAAERLQRAARTLRDPYRNAAISALADVIDTARRVSNAIKLLRATEIGGGR